MSSVTDTGPRKGFSLSCTPTVKVLVRKISKDISEVGLQNIIKSGFEGDILNIRFIPRKRENFNRAEIIVRTMREARLLFDFLERNKNFPNLSPKIIRDEESDTNDSSDDFPHTRPSALSQPQTKPKSVDPPLLDPLQQQQPDEVFTFNRPFLVENKAMARAQKPSEERTDIPGIKRTVLVSTDSGEDQDQRLEETLNQPIVLDDETFKLRYQARKARKALDEMKMVLDENWSNDNLDEQLSELCLKTMKESNKKSLKNVTGVEMEASRPGELPSGGAGPADLSSSSSSDDVEPPFYKTGPDTDTPDSQEVPLMSSSTGVKVPEQRPVEKEDLEIWRGFSGRSKPDKSGVDEKRPDLASQDLKKDRMNEVVSEAGNKTSRDHSSPAVGGQSEERKKAVQFPADENQNNPRKAVDTKLPKNWTPAEIFEVIAVEENDLPILVIQTKDSYFDAMLDPAIFELTAPLDRTMCKRFKKHLKGNISVKRVGWIDGEKPLNIVELQRVDDEGFDLNLASQLCRLRLVRKKANAASQVLLEEGATVHWRGFGKFSYLAKLQFSKKQDRQRLEAVMPGTDCSKTVAPELGQIVAIPNQEGDRGVHPFLRAKIVKVSAWRLLCELLDDHGRYVCSHEDLHPLPPAAWEIAPLACEVILQGVQALPRAEAKSKLEPFREMIVQSELFVQIISQEDKVVRLLGPDGNSFNEILVEILDGKYDDNSTQVEVEEEEVIAPLGRARVRGSEKEEMKMDKGVKEKEVKKIDKVEKIPQNNLVENLNVEWLTSYHVLPLGEKITVRVLHFSSWSNLFVCTEAQFPQLMKFQVDLQYVAEKTKKVSMSSDNLGIGQFLIFKFGDDWFRGIVAQLRKDGKVKMFAPDFGFSSRSFRVTGDNVRPLPSEEVGSTKFWASACCLSQTNTERTPESKQEEDKLEISVIRMENIKYIIKNH